MIRFWFDSIFCFVCDSFFCISNFLYWDIFYLSFLIEIFFLFFYFDMLSMWFVSSIYCHVFFAMCSLFSWSFELFWRWSIVQTSSILFRSSQRMMLFLLFFIVSSLTLIVSLIVVKFNCFEFDSHNVVSIAQDFD